MTPVDQLSSQLMPYDHDASRPLSNAEKLYAVIEKGVWACEKLTEYVVGKDFVLETDHKPLQTLFNTTELSKTLPHSQRFRLWLMRFSITVKYFPGTRQLTADALSCAPIESRREKELESFPAQTVFTLPTTTQRLSKI